MAVDPSGKYGIGKKFLAGLPAAGTITEPAIEVKRPGCGRFVMRPG
jgi:hypothetical protein